MTREEIPVSRLIDMIHRSGIRPSAQRIAVLSYVANTDTHPSADAVYEAVTPLYPGMSRTTVYNSLHVLVDAGLVKELDVECSIRRYELAPQPRHSHFACRKCGRIIDMSMPEHVDRHGFVGFEVDSVEVVYRGLCPDCCKQTDDI